VQRAGGPGLRCEEAAAELPNVKISIAHGPAGFFAEAGTVIMTNQA
jgi:hypothetical protein